MNAFLGFGKFAKQLIDNFDLSDDFVVFDSTNEGPVTFDFNEHMRYSMDFEWIVSLGYLHLSKKHAIVSNLVEAGAMLKSLIHPTCIIGKRVSLLSGCIVYRGCLLDNDVIVSNGSVLNNSVIVSHNSTVGECTYVSPGVVISGDVKIGDRCFIGSGSVISNGVSIGDDSVVGIGSVVTKDVPAGSHVIGNPMRFLDKKIKLV